MVSLVISMFSLPLRSGLGDYALLKNGYATTVVSDQAALEILQLLEELSKADSD